MLVSLCLSLNSSQKLRIIESKGTAMSESKGKRAMAANCGEGASSGDPELGLQRVCVPSLKEKVERFRSQNKGKKPRTPSIWRVRTDIRNQDPGAYEPKLVPIGPYHYGKESSLMEELKLHNLCHMLEMYPDITIEALVDEVLVLLPEVRDEYSENIGLPDNIFAEMLVTDSCFLLGFFQNWTSVYESQLLAQIKGSIEYLWRDFMLLENQIPLFIVRKLSDKIGGTPSFDFVASVAILIYTEIPKSEKYPKEDECRHLLHLKQQLLHPDLLLEETPRLSFCQRLKIQVKRLVGWIIFQILGLFYVIRFCDCSNLFGFCKESRKMNPLSTIPCASELYESGMKFQKMSLPQEDFTSVIPKASFKHGTLVLPLVYIDDLTCSALRNLIAFEQCINNATPYITSYCSFLDDLINTADDVAILRRSGVLVNMLGSDSEVAEMFNSLCKEIHSDLMYQTVYEDLTNFYEIPQNRWRANLSQKYFSNPWTFFSVVAAATLIVFTITQTIYTIKQANQPPRAL